MLDRHSDNFHGTGRTYWLIGAVRLTGWIGVFLSSWWVVNCRLDFCPTPSPKINNQINCLSPKGRFHQLTLTMLNATNVNSLWHFVAISREEKNHHSIWWILLHWARLHTSLLLHCVACGRYTGCMWNAHGGLGLIVNCCFKWMFPFN